MQEKGPKTAIYGKNPSISRFNLSKYPQNVVDLPEKCMIYGIFPYYFPLNFQPFWAKKAYIQAFLTCFAVKTRITCMLYFV